MAFTVPVEIVDIIISHVEDDKFTLLNLLLTSHAFRRIAEPRLYASISFLPSFSPVPGLRLNGAKGGLSATARSFLCCITAGSGGRALHVKRILLPGTAFGREQYPLFQRILKSLPNLEDLQFHRSSQLANVLHPLNLRAFFTDPQGLSSPPPFMLKSLVCYGGVKLNKGGLEWFLASQITLERLVIPGFLRIPTLPRLCVIDTSTLDVASTVFETNQITHIRAKLDDLERLNDVALSSIVVCVTRISEFRRLAAVAARMPNLECLEIDPGNSPIFETLSQIDIFKGTKLRHLRLSSAQEEAGWVSRPGPPNDGPWDGVVSAFDKLPSLFHISFPLTSLVKFTEYCCFTRGAPLPVKLRSLRPAVTPHAEWWLDWVKDCTIAPFDTSDSQATCWRA
ncbi:hypothetical protein CCMSSC00406_0007055 [Pleurotus cornucopiae]|uniref:Uncharacterized protein n=1 Tax=Pleurotus cornucopiae TaxID=5321 RepID=A0ACB7J3S5_PLECO|nr:hypothetical protein CCMSSC00406_0007055 [Pleurotus cornucopiae]